MLFRHELPRFEHEEAQLLHRQALRPRIDRDAQQPQESPHEYVGDPERPRESLHEGLQHVARREGRLFRKTRADHLRRDLGEHEDQERDCDGRHSENDLVVSEQPDRDHADQHRDHGVHQRVACKQHRKEPVCLAQQLGGEPRAAVAGALERAQAVAVDRHHPGLGHREKTGNGEQDSERDELRR